MVKYSQKVIVSISPTGTVISLGWVPGGYVKIGEHTLEGEYDPNAVAPELIAKLKEGLADADAEHQKKRNAILDQIGKLQAIGMNDPLPTREDDDIPF